MSDIKTEGTVGPLKWTRVGQSTFTFRDMQGIEIRLRNVRQKDGNVHGDLMLFVADVRRLVRPNVNLTSDRTLPALEKSFAAATEGAAELWHAYLETMCAILVDQLEVHGVLTELTAVDPAQLSQPCLFKNRFIPVGAVTGILAHGGVGKSMTAAMLAIAITTGQRIGPFDPELTGPVLYVDWENDDMMHRRRITRICMGLGMDFPKGIAHFGTQAQLGSVEAELLELCVERKVVAVIFDSIGAACEGANLNASEVATSFIASVKRFPGTKIVLGHVSKNQLQGGNEQLGPMGNAMFWNGMQTIYDLKVSEQSVRDKTSVFTFSHNKSNLIEKQGRPVGVSLQFTDPAGPIVPSSEHVEGDSLAGAVMKLNLRIGDYLAHNGRATAKEIGDGLNEKWQTVESELRRMRTAGDVIALGGSQGQKDALQQWGLAADEPKTAPLAPVVPAFIEDFDFGCAKCGNPAVFRFDDDGTALCEVHAL